MEYQIAYYQNEQWHKQRVYLQSMRGLPHVQVLCWSQARSQKLNLKVKSLFRSLKLQYPRNLRWVIELEKDMQAEGLETLLALAILNQSLDGILCLPMKLNAEFYWPRDWPPQAPSYEKIYLPNTIESKAAYCNLNCLQDLLAEKIEWREPQDLYISQSIGRELYAALHFQSASLHYQNEEERKEALSILYHWREQVNGEWEYCIIYPWMNKQEIRKKAGRFHFLLCFQAQDLSDLQKDLLAKIESYKCFYFYMKSSPRAGFNAILQSDTNKTKWILIETKRPTLSKAMLSAIQKEKCYKEIYKLLVISCSYLQKEKASWCDLKWAKSRWLTKKKRIDGAIKSP